MVQPLVFEGTADEIAIELRKAAPKGQRLKVVVMPEEVPSTGVEYQPDKTHFYFTATPEEFERAFDAIAEGSQGLPILPPEAFERESIYEDVPYRLRS